jgi:hypothetical protein
MNMTSYSGPHLWICSFFLPQCDKHLYPEDVSDSELVALGLKSDVENSPVSTSTRDFPVFTGTTSQGLSSEEPEYPLNMGSDEMYKEEVVNDEPEYPLNMGDGAPDEVELVHHSNGESVSITRNAHA